MDRVGEAVSAIGTAHLVLAGMASLLSMLAIFGGIRAGRRGTRRVSALALAIVFVTGALAALGTASGWPLAGLLERMTIGTFLAWLAVYAFATARASAGRPSAPASPRRRIPRR
ncbi:MAG: hypothetical protein ACYC0C_17625 [Devosia sp.]